MTRLIVVAMAVALGPVAAADPAPGVTISLERIAPGGPVLSFGLPLPPGVGEVKVDAPGAVVTPLLDSYDASGKKIGLRAVLVQLPAAAMTGRTLELHATWGPRPASKAGAARALVPFAAVSFDSAETTPVVERVVEKDGGGYRLAEKASRPHVFYLGREPAVVARFPDGYLAGTGILGEQIARKEAMERPAYKGLSFLSEGLVAFTRSALYQDGFTPTDDPQPEDSASAPVYDPIKEPEAWLYDRCLTYLIATAHANELSFQRAALRACSFYASKITDDGYFALKLLDNGRPGDSKYSHSRGLYAYYALTGDEAAQAAIRRIGRMWLNDRYFVVPYRQGSVRGATKLWTERLLGASLEGLIYGFLATGDEQLLAGARNLVDVAYTHISTTDPERLNAITRVNLPPQGCFIHSSQQHEGDGKEDPWCSAWMSELVVDPLLRFQELTADRRVDEIFLLLARFLRDTGTIYFQNGPQTDSFLAPAVCLDPDKQGEDPRVLEAVYGGGRRADGSRFIEAEWDDFQHCPDVTVLVAVGLRAAKRLGEWDKPGPAPFKTQGDSLLALHQEIAACAAYALSGSTRPRRDPRVWKSADLADGFGKGMAWIRQQKIGWQIHASSPPRKYSWWFNTSMQQVRLLESAGITVPALQVGRIQPSSGKCPARTWSLVPTLENSRAPAPR